MKARNKHLRQVLFIPALLFILLIGSCSNQKQETIDDQALAIDSLQQEIQVRNESFNEVLDLLGEAEGQVAMIMKREKLVAGNDEGKNSEQLLKEISMIDDLVSRSNETIKKLNDKLKVSDLRLTNLQKRINKLVADLKERDKTLKDLRADLMSREEQIQILAGKYDSIQMKAATQKVALTESRQEVELLESNNDKLNKIYYTVGSVKELASKGIVSKEGGFLGIGRTVSLEPGADINEFIEMDIRKLNKLPLEAKEVELISEHPEDTYSIVQDEIEENIKYLEITDPEGFWKVSKYLVISTKS